MKKSQFRIPLFYAATALYWFSLYTYVSTLSPYVRSLGASYRMVGLVIGSYGFSQMLLRIPLGILSDRLGRRKLFVIVGMALSLVSGLGMWLFKSPGTLLLFRSVSGAAAAAWVSFTVLFSSYFKADETPRAIGFINATNSAGCMAGIFLGGAAAQRFGSPAPFLMAFVSAALALVLSFFVVENRELSREPVTIPELVTVAKDHDFLIVSILAIFSQFISFATVYGFTPVAAKAIGATSFDLGLLTALSVLPGIFASVLSGTVFARRFGEKKVIACGFLITAASCVLIPFIRSLPVLYLTQMLGGFGLGGVFPMLMGLCIKNVEGRKRSTAMGFFQAIYGIGMFAGPLAVCLLTDFAGLRWGMWAIGLVGLAGIVTAQFYRGARQAPQG